MHFVVKANDGQGKTGLNLSKGQKLRMRVEPGQTWCDLTTVCGPEGWNTWLYSLFNCLKVIPSSNYLRLIYGVNGEGAVAYGEVGLDGWTYYVADKDGELTLLPNDVPALYFNNTGSIVVEVELV